MALSTDGLRARLRALRVERGLSLRGLASRADVTASFLSAVERGQSSPSLATLLRLCEVLDVTLVELLTEPGQSESLVRADRRRVLLEPDNDLRVEVLVEDAGRPFDVLFVRLAPGAATAPTLRAHDAHEATFIVAGRARFEFEDRSYELSAGDTLFYSSREPHRIVNIGLEDEVALISCIAGRF
jgi:transcriptional regulator with XRE-family HTH domain